MIHAQNKQRIYSILLRNLLNSDSDFTQFGQWKYSILVVLPNCCCLVKVLHGKKAEIYIRTSALFHVERKTFVGQ